MNEQEKAEFAKLVDVLDYKHFQRLGIIFYDPHTKLLGIAQLHDAPDAFIEEIGQRLGGTAKKIGEVVK